MTSVSQIGCETGLARAIASPSPRSHGGRVLAASSIGCCLVFISGAVINVALASIGQDLSLAARSLQGILNAEPLPLAALALVGGALGDRYSQGRVFLVGIAVCAIALLGCVLAKN